MNDQLATIEAPDDLKTEVALCVQWSSENAIVTSEHYTVTADHLKAIKGVLKKADEFFDPPIKQAYDLHKMLVARKKVITNPLAESEDIDKEKMLRYTTEQQRIADEERRRLQAIADEKARKEREVIEQAARRQREIEVAARAKAEAARKEAEQASAAERRKLLAQAEAAERKAAEAIAKQEFQAEAAAAVVAPVVQVQSVAPKIAGQRTSTTWVHEIVDFAAFATWAIANKRFELLAANDKMLSAFAKGMREQASMPGVVFKAKQSLASTAR